MGEGIYNCFAPSKEEGENEKEFIIRCIKDSEPLTLSDLIKHCFSQDFDELKLYRTVHLMFEEGELKWDGNKTIKLSE